MWWSTSKCMLSRKYIHWKKQSTKNIAETLENKLSCTITNRNTKKAMAYIQKAAVVSPYGLEILSLH